MASGNKQIGVFMIGLMLLFLGTTTVVVEGIECCQGHVTTCCMVMTPMPAFMPPMTPMPAVMPPMPAVMPPFLIPPIPAPAPVVYEKKVLAPIPAFMPPMPAFMPPFLIPPIPAPAAAPVGYEKKVLGRKGHTIIQ
ncbi:hypothetical protein L2E82_29175 [Cichorium intybus]|uniref:Uncharacterized protein n=1 Tax=Cichorium intybus TaxID=13427 RepID=A0ACB9CXD6_CICIN|nr:hypothetical protein L2E82_29175 [Cichorium intybus]